MTFVYKDRAKQLLQAAAYENTLSPPPTGFVSLPTEGDFEGVIVCADGSWQTGVFEVSDQGGGVSALSYVKVYSNSSGTTSNIMSSRDFSVNNAEVFCTITARTMGRLGAIIDAIGDVEPIKVQSAVAPSSSNVVAVEPNWPGHASCPVEYVEYEINVFAGFSGSAYSKTWKGAATFSDVAGSDATASVVLGAAATDFGLSVAINATSGKPVLELTCANAHASYAALFDAEIVVKRLIHPSSCG